MWNKNYELMFNFLVEKYGFDIKSLTFEEGKRDLLRHCTCFYNDHGCFVINEFPNHFNEVFTYFVVKKFSTKWRDLTILGKEVIVHNYEKQIWHKYFSSKTNETSVEVKELKALCEVIKKLINDNNEFFGIKVRKKM